MNELFLMAGAFLMGLSLGSFLNVVVDRTVRSESMLTGRSYCESCKRTLQWFDLIPLVSFALLKGKCRYCHKSLSLYYPLVELVTGIALALLFYRFFLPVNSSDLLHLLFFVYILSALLVIFFADLKYGIIPDKILFPAIVISLLYSLFFSHEFLQNVQVGLGLFLFFLFLFLSTKGKGMGFGDVKFVFLIGILLGFPKALVAVYFAFLTGAFVSIILLLGARVRLKDAIAFGPFLVLGTVIAFLFTGPLFKAIGFIY